jgi:hypothetical protein
MAHVCYQDCYLTTICPVGMQFIFSDEKHGHMRFVHGVRNDEYRGLSILPTKNPRSACASCCFSSTGVYVSLIAKCVIV